MTSICCHLGVSPGDGDEGGGTGGELYAWVKAAVLGNASCGVTRAVYMGTIVSNTAMQQIRYHWQLDGLNGIGSHTCIALPSSKMGNMTAAVPPTPGHQ
jgi:hypothetical protein